MTSNLYITDGTVYIGLLNTKAGLGLNNWRPQTPDYKDGGVWQDSPLSDGRRLSFRKFSNIIDTFALASSGGSQDDLIYNLQEARRLLELAADYWGSDWQRMPVWLEARGTCETNTRYAIIMRGRIPEDDAPYSSPFIGGGAQGGVAMANLTLIIEHSLWRSVRPGTDSALGIGASQTYNGIALGNVSTAGAAQPATNGVFLTNKRPVANLTHIFDTSAGGALFGANHIDQPKTTPDGMLTTPPVAVGDAIYFGVSTAVADSGPFSSMVTNLSVGSTHSLAWQYWNGAWVSLSASINLDQTNQFAVTGIKLVQWTPPADWTTTTVNGVTGYWVRLAVTVGVGVSGPVQITRNIYSITWPYTGMLAANVGGDVPAYMNQLVGETSVNNFDVARVLVGSRTLNRGALFTAYLNAVAAQNPSGTTFATATAEMSTPVADITAPAGAVSRFTGGGSARAAATRLSWTLNDVLSPNYLGAFRLFVRVKQTAGSAGQLGVRGAVQFSGDSRYTGDRKSTLQINIWQLLDLGVVRLPTVLVASGTLLNLQFKLEVDSTAAGVTADFSDIILLPVDEWSADYQAVDPTDTISSSGVHGRFGSTLFPKAGHYGARFSSASSTYVDAWQVISASPAQLQANVDSRLWYLFASRPSSVATGENWQAPFQITVSLRIGTSQRYLSMRGAR